MGPVFRPPQSAADVAAIAGAKKVLRSAVLQRRAVRPDAQRNSDDTARFGQLQAFLAGSRLRTAACYFSVPPEPGTLQLIAWLASREVRVLLPVIDPPDDPHDVVGDPDWAPYAGPDELRQGRLSLIEPTTQRLGAAALGEAELIIVPGLAGSSAGERLGRGGGWYDRALGHSDRSAVTVLLLNDDEVLDVVPAHRHDRRVDVIITPTRVVDCS